MCLYNTKQETKFMLNIKLINRLICLEQVVDAMFKDDAPEIAEALKVCINIIFGDMVADHTNAIEQQYFSDKEVEEKIADLSKAKITTDHIKQIQDLYKQLKDKK
jgi:hypothetical protein